MSTRADLLTLVGRAADGHRVAVAGDVMLDHFLIGRVDRISPEAPVPVVRFDRDEFRLGGAANVAHNIAALGGHARVVGLVGRDEAAAELRRQLHRAHLDASGLVDDAVRPTTKKTRIVTTRNQQVARIDQEDDSEASGPALAALIERIAAGASDAAAIVVSDYRKGVVTRDTVAAAAAAADARRIPLLVDPKVPDVERYRGATIITPNHHEAELMTHHAIRTPADARDAARRLHERIGASVIITWGEHGMWVYDAVEGDERALPAIAREVADVTGAGDTVIAVLALAMAAGAPLGQAAELANVAAGLVVARFGPAAVTRDELMQAIGAAGA